MNQSIFGVILILVAGLCWAIGIYDQMCAREARRRMAKVERTMQLQQELVEATQVALATDLRRREALRWHRELDYQRWRTHFREAEQQYYCQKFRLMWDGRVA